MSKIPFSDRNADEDSCVCGDHAESNLERKSVSWISIQRTTRLLDFGRAIDGLTRSMDRRLLLIEAPVQMSRDPSNILRTYFYKLSTHLPFANTVWSQLKHHEFIETIANHRIIDEKEWRSAVDGNENNIIS